MTKKEKDKELILNFIEFIKKQISIELSTKNFECKKIKGRNYFFVDLSERLNISNRDLNKLESFQKKYNSFDFLPNVLKTIAVYNYSLKEL